MAAENLYSPSNKALYNELKKRFQEVPALIIETVMIQNAFVREKCILALGRESHHYLQSPDNNMPTITNQFHSLQITGTENPHTSQPHSFHYDTPNITIKNKIHPNSTVPNNGLRYHDSPRHFEEPVSAPVRPHDFEPYYSNVSRAQPPSIPGQTTGNSATPNRFSHSISHSGVFPPEYPYHTWSYLQQYPPQSHGAYSPSQEGYSPAGQVVNSPVTTQRAHLPGSPNTPPALLPSNIAHVTPSSAHPRPMSPAQISTAPSYPMQFNTPFNGLDMTMTMGAPGDSKYEEALLHHQEVRLQKLLHDLQQSKDSLNRYKERVSDMENKCLERRRRRRSNSFPSVEDVQKMRDENRKLRVDIGVLFTQIDGQTQLGSSQGQNFYSNIGKGQGGSIHGMKQTGTGDNHTVSSSQQRVPPRRPPPPNFLQMEQPSSNSPLPRTLSSYTPPRNATSPATPPHHSFGPSIPKQPNASWLVQPAIPESAHSPSSAVGSAAVASALNRPSDQGPPRPPKPRTLVNSSSGRNSDDEEEKWNCSACTFLNHPSLDKCEVCEMPRIITGNFYGSGVR